MVSHLSLTHREGVLSDRHVAAAWSALEKQIALRDPYEKSENPLPLSVVDMVVRACMALGFAALGVLAAGQILSRTESAVQTLVLAVALVAPSALLTWWPLGRWAAWSWSLGIGLTAAAALMATI